MISPITLGLSLFKSKSDVYQRLVDFFNYVSTQFHLPIKCLQADNGTEFVNHTTANFLASCGTLLRLFCPYTSQKNGKTERVLRTLNNSVRTLFMHASMPPKYWAEALSTATYLLNRRPSTSIQNSIPFQLLHGTTPDYSHLRVFGCLCYPNLSATAEHKLVPRTVACVFLGYPSSHKGYRCLDLSTQRVIVSRRVVFDESAFPFSSSSPSPPRLWISWLMMTATYRCFPALRPLRPHRVLSNRAPARPLRPLWTSSVRPPSPAPLPRSVEHPRQLLQGPGGCGHVPPPGHSTHHLDEGPGGSAHVPSPGSLLHAPVPAAHGPVPAAREPPAGLPRVPAAPASSTGPATASAAPGAPAIPAGPLVRLLCRGPCMVHLPLCPCMALHMGVLVGHLACVIHPCMALDQEVYVGLLASMVLERLEGVSATSTAAGSPCMHLFRPPIVLLPLRRTAPSRLLFSDRPSRIDVPCAARLHRPLFGAW
jgi:hypothetical protein